jgi:hypothetical protein
MSGLLPEGGVAEISANKEVNVAWRSSGPRGGREGGGKLELF